MDEPTRFLDDPTAPPGLKEDLRAAAEIAPQKYDEERGLERLRTALVAGTAGAAAATSATASAGVKAGLAWTALAVVVAAGMGGALYVWAEPEPSSEAEERARPHAPAASEAAAPLPTEPSVDAVAPTPALTTDQTSDAPSPEGPTPSAPTATDESGPTASSAPAARAVADSTVARGAATTGSSAASAPAATEEPAMAAESAPTATESAPTAAESAAAVAPEEDPDGRLRAEIGQLARIRSRLETAPAEALALAREGQRRFEGGMFGEERAALVVFALDRLGRHAEAEREARRFVEAHPVGPFTSRVRAVLERE